MKLFLAFVFFHFSCITCFNQEIIVSLTRENKIYLGIDNPVSAMVENLPCKSIFYKIDNGVIEKDPSGSDCDYIIRPESEGTTKIYVCRLNKKDTVIIDSVFYHAKDIPNPVAMIANKKGGYINKNTLAAQPTLFAVLEGFGFDLKFIITNYTIIILRDEKVMFVSHNENSRITQEVKYAIKETATNDKVFFLNIIATGPDQKPRNLNPIDFTIE